MLKAKQAHTKQSLPKLFHLNDHICVFSYSPQTTTTTTTTMKGNAFAVCDYAKRQTHFDNLKDHDAMFPTSTS